MKKLSMAAITLAMLGGGSAWANSHGQVTYNDHIKPVMEQQCFACHGASSPSIGEFNADMKKYTIHDGGAEDDHLPGAGSLRQW